MCLCCFIKIPCFSWFFVINCQLLPRSQHTARLPPWSLSPWKSLKSSSKCAVVLCFNKPSTIYFPSFPPTGRDCCFFRRREGCWLPPSVWWAAHTRRTLWPREHGLTQGNGISDTIYIAHTFCHSLCCCRVLITQMCIMGIHHISTYTAVHSWLLPPIPELCGGMMGSPTWSHGAWTVTVIKESIFPNSPLSLL